MANSTVWRAIAEALAAEGVEYVFGLPGNVQHLLLDIFEHTNIKFVLVRHENSAVACALSYARLTGRPGVVMTNPGPGITNIATGLLEATSASVPVIAIANGVVLSDDGKGAFQELDSVALLRPATKWAVRLVEPKMAQWTVRRAFSNATCGRPGAVFIDVPSDFVNREVEFPEYLPSNKIARVRPPTTSLAEAARLIESAKRPVLLAGSGAISSGAAAELLEFAQTTGTAIYTTPGGRGIIAEDSPLSLGQAGLYFTEWGLSYWNEADLLISLGSRLESFSTQNWLFFPPNCKFIQIDISPETVGLNWVPDVALVGDARETMASLTAEVLKFHGSFKQGKDARVREIARLHDIAVKSGERTASEATAPVRVPQVLSLINKVFGDETVLCKENGGADLWCYYWPYYKVLTPYDCVPMGEQTAMGMGIIGTIGAKIAKPDKKVISICGDGAMNMAMMELATAAENKLGVTWIVLNNGALGWVQYTQVMLDKDFRGTQFTVNADFSAIAVAQGCVGIRVEHGAEVEAALESALEANSRGVPALIDIRIRPHDYTEHFVAMQRLPLSH